MLSCSQQSSSEGVLPLQISFESLRSLNMSQFTHQPLKDNLINPQIDLQALMEQNYQKYFPMFHQILSMFQYNLGLRKIWKSVNWNGK